MLMFLDDYSEGAHPAVLKALVAHNGGQEFGYGEDRYSRLAAARIAAEVGRDCEVHLLVGGTQTNLTCLGAFLRSHEGVVAAETAHINVHETGAIEATGHRIVQIPTPTGKLDPGLVDEALALSLIHIYAPTPTSMVARVQLDSRRRWRIPSARAACRAGPIRSSSALGRRVRSGGVPFFCATSVLLFWAVLSRPLRRAWPGHPETAV